MNTIQVELPLGQYPVYIGPGILDDSSTWQQHLGDGQLLVVSNDVVAPLYLSRLRAALSDRELTEHIIADGEHCKTSETWSGIIDHLVAMQARRDTCVIALGGGVVGDITGFASACYMRGVRFVQIPTTLLAQVDASVGGKTGINHRGGKNLMGAFHQPSAVIIDTETLKTLNPREFKAGLAEVVKYGAIMDPALFDWMEGHAGAILEYDGKAIEHIILRSVENKANIVAMDEREAGVRAILNFGHSFGHALETLTGYRQFLHGEAVAIGMTVASRLSESRGLCPAETANRIKALLQRFNLEVKIPAGISSTAMVDTMDLDKKALSSGQRLILLSDLGKATIDSGSSREEMIAAIEYCRTA